MSVITDGGFHPVGGQIGYGPGVPSENGFITVEGKTWTDHGLTPQHMVFAGFNQPATFVNEDVRATVFALKTKTERLVT